MREEDDLEAFGLGDAPSGDGLGEAWDDILGENDLHQAGRYNALTVTGRTSANDKRVTLAFRAHIKAGQTISVVATPMNTFHAAEISTMQTAAHRLAYIESFFVGAYRQPGIYGVFPSRFTPVAGVSPCPAGVSMTFSVTNPSSEDIDWCAYVEGTCP